ncbi:MAG TPA: helix-turn-helix transcriptional regulator [Bacteroidaceae bacterium]|nr:helix-turn-helix transcriptional regulator [Bacteroidaceae bacterium]
MHTIEIAIITPNTLEAEGLKHLLLEACADDMQLIVRPFTDYGALMDDTPDMYQWYFVTPQYYALFNSFFNQRQNRCIILMQGTAPLSMPTGTHYLQTSMARSRLRVALSLLLAGVESPETTHPVGIEENPDLSQREIEVLQLVVHGLINKEIADKLCISLTTVISHRKNITNKLGIKSVAGLTVYAVMNGLVRADRI